jgi:hypothetical protein
MRYVLLSLVVGVLLIVLELCLLAWMHGWPFVGTDEAAKPLCFSCMKEG